MAENDSGMFIEDGFTRFMTDFSPKAEAVEAFYDYAGIILEYAKSNAPWEDRTGDARNGLEVLVEEDGEEVSLTLYHTVEYGVWLETIQSGEFAIILPTLELFATPAFQAAGGRVTGETGGGF